MDALFGWMQRDYSTHHSKLKWIQTNIWHGPCNNATVLGTECGRMLHETFGTTVATVSDQTSCMRPAMTAALTPPATGRVSTHARKMLLNSFQSTFCRDRAQPTNTTEPTLQCVVLIGRPRLDAVRTVIAAPSSMQNPLHSHTDRHHKMISIGITDNRHYVINTAGQGWTPSGPSLLHQAQCTVNNDTSSKRTSVNWIYITLKCSYGDRQMLQTEQQYSCK